MYFKDPHTIMRTGAHKSRYSSTGVGFENPSANLSPSTKGFPTISIARASARAHKKHR